MDLLPIEFSQLGRAPVKGPATSDSFAFFEALLRAEPADVDDLAPAAEDPWEPSERAELPDLEEAPREPVNNTSPEKDPVRTDHGSKEPPIDHAQPKEVVKDQAPGTLSTQTFGSVPQAFGPLETTTVGQASQATPADAKGIPGQLVAEATPRTTPPVTRPRFPSSSPTVANSDKPGSAPTQSKPAPDPGLPATPTAPVQRAAARTDQPGAGSDSRVAPDIKPPLADIVAAKSHKSGRSETAPSKRRTTPSAANSRAKASPATLAKTSAGAHKPGQTEGAGGVTSSALAKAATATATNIAAAPGPATTAFGMTLPTAPPPAGTAAEPLSLDTPTPGRRGGAVEQVAIKLQVAAKQGQDRISIRLHPAELGRVEVKLDLGEDGPLRAVLIAERSETLELLQRDARQLERALEQAGLKLDSGSLEFGLRGQDRHGAGSQSTELDGSELGPSEAGDEGRMPPDTGWSVHDGILDLVV